MRAFNPNPVKWAVLGALAVLSMARIEAAPAAQPKPTPDAGASDNDTSFDNLEILDNSLNGKLAVLRVGSEASPNNLLTVFAGLKNKTAHALTLELETLYRDSEGNPVNTGSWIALTLKPHEEKEYRSTSISEQFDPSAVTPKFLIRIRLPVRAAPAHN